MSTTPDPPSAPMPGAADLTIVEAAPGSLATMREPGRAAAAPGAAAPLMAGTVIAGHALREPMPVLSGEADLWLAESLADGVTRVVKMYRFGWAPKPEVLAKLRQLDPRHVVPIIAAGEEAGRPFEVQEYVPLGALTRWIVPGAPLAPDRARAMLAQIADALVHLHANGLIHRDLKPSNILVRREDPLDLLLTDFGIASATSLTLHVTTANRTVAYAPPEALTGVLTPSSDWWSVGIILLEALTGAHPFAGIGERAINFQLVSQEVAIPDALPGEWALLLAGLLTRDSRLRWGEEQVRAWQAGRRDIPVAARHATAAQEGRAVKPYRFAHGEAWTAEELAELLLLEWPEAVKHRARGFVATWVEADLHRQDLASLLVDIDEDPLLNAAQKLSVTLLALHPDLPLIVEGEVIGPAWFVHHPEAARTLFRSTIGKWLQRLRGDASLVERARRYDLTMAQLSRLGTPGDRGLAETLALSDPDEVLAMAAEQRSAYAGAKLLALSDLLAREEAWTLPESIYFLAADRRLLLTPEAAEAENERQMVELKFELKTTASQTGIEVNEAELDDWLATSERETIAAGEEIRAQVSYSPEPNLERILSASRLTRAQALLLLCAPSHLLQTPEEHAEFIAAEQDRRDELARWRQERQDFLARVTAWSGLPRFGLCLVMSPYLAPRLAWAWWQSRALPGRLEAEAVAVRQADYSAEQQMRVTLLVSMVEEAVIVRRNVYAHCLVFAWTVTLEAGIVVFLYIMLTFWTSLHPHLK